MYRHNQSKVFLRLFPVSCILYNNTRPTRRDRRISRNVLDKNHNCTRRIF